MTAITFPASPYVNQIYTVGSKSWQWATESLNVVAVTDSVPYVYGLWDGTNFHSPETEYLESIGVSEVRNEQADIDKINERQALLDKLGITTEEEYAI